MKNKKLIFDVFTLIFSVIIIFWITQIDYNDLSFKKNISAYFGITSAVLFIFAMQMAKKGVNKNKNE